ncbi:MAG: hypothetical protein GY795_08885 [Desulfobacterales bacterium]|nr:hypothetical protein [Desulfobacterales bacterium]
MKKIIFIITLAVSFISGTACAAEWVNISGTVYYGSQPLNAMVLANGQHMFTGPADGRYELEVPLNEDGEITLFGFCDGFAPFRQILKPQEAEYFDISMVPASDGKELIIGYTQKPAASADRVKIKGSVSYAGRRLCAMVLANGQHTFTCTEEGVFELEVTPNENGKITLFGFCDGFAPFKGNVELPDLSKDYDGDGYSVNDGDCDDTSRFTNPGTAEICGDEIDQNCNGDYFDCDTVLKGSVFDYGETARETSSYITIAGAEASLMPVDPSPVTWPETLHAYTGEDGGYEFSDLPAGEYECRITVEAEGYEQWENIVTVTHGLNIQRVKLMPALTCSEDDECPGDLFCAKLPGDCDGTGMCSGVYRICNGDYTPVCGCDGWTYGNKCGAGVFAVNVAYKGECVPSPESGILSVHVYEDASACATEKCIVPFAEVRVTQILSSDSKKGRFPRGDSADEEGFYKYPVIPAGEYELLVRKPGYQIRESIVSVSAGEETVQNVYLTPIIAESVLKGHVYDGSVICGTGETCTPVPVANAYVSIYYREPDVITQIPLEKYHSANTDSEGYYEFSGLSEVEYDMKVSAEWYQSAPLQTVKIEEGENVLDVYLMPFHAYK